MFSFSWFHFHPSTWLLIVRLVHLTSVTWWMDPFSAFFIGIFLRFGWSGVNLRIWITCSDGVNIFKISNVTTLTAWPRPIVKLRSRSRSRSGKGQEGQIWTWAVPYFWFSPEYLGEFLEFKSLSETKREERQGAKRKLLGRWIWQFRLEAGQTCCQ